MQRKRKGKRAYQKQAREHGEEGKTNARMILVRTLCKGRRGLVLTRIVARVHPAFLHVREELLDGIVAALHATAAGCR